MLSIYPSIGTSWLVAVISCKSRYPFAVSCLAVPEGPTPWWLIQSVIAVAVFCIHPSDRCFHLGVIYSKWFWFPVWLEEVNVECPRPVLKHSFLCDEPMMAALSSPLVWNVHCAFIGSQRFIIMIRYWKMIRIPAGEKKNRWKPQMFYFTDWKDVIFNKLMGSNPLLLPVKPHFQVSAFFLNI